jgi:hypothetical protein
MPLSHSLTSPPVISSLSFVQQRSEVEMMMISFLLLSVGAATNPDFCHTLLFASDPLFPAAKLVCQVSE